MVAIGYAASGLCTDDVCYYEVGPDGELIREKWFKAPYYCMMHDFGITPDYLVLHIVPSIGSWERLEAMKPHFGFDTIAAGLSRRCIPRRDDMKPEDIRWFKRDNCFASHVLNAWQEGTKIHFVTPEAKNNMFPFFPDVNDAPFNPMEAASRLTDWTVDLASNGDEFDAITRLTETVGEFPRIDDRFTGREEPLRLGPRDGHAPPGRDQGAQRRRHADELPVPQGPRDRRRAALVVRPGLAPCRSRASSRARRTRPRATAGSSRSATGSTSGAADLLLFDALEIEKGPIATIQVPIRLRFGFHGNFATSEELGLKDGVAGMIRRAAFAALAALALAPPLARRTRRQGRRRRSWRCAGSGSIRRSTASPSATPTRCSNSRPVAAQRARCGSCRRRPRPCGRCAGELRGIRRAHLHQRPAGDPRREDRVRGLPQPVGRADAVHLVLDGQDDHRHAGRHRARAGQDRLARRSGDKYVPELAGSGYDGVTIRQVLQMRSGVDYQERYDFGANPSFAGKLHEQAIVLNRMRFADGRARDQARQCARQHVQLLDARHFRARLGARAGDRQAARRVHQEVLWGPLGAEADGFWLADGPPGAGRELRAWASTRCCATSGGSAS